jgi:hypothetical protein
MVISGRNTLMPSAASAFYFMRVIIRAYSEQSNPENIKQTPKLDQIKSQHFAPITTKQRTKTGENEKKYKSLK